jgi:hypothetical protein
VALAPRFARLRDERVRLRLTLVASGTYAAVFVLLTWQALRGQALLAPDATTLAVAGTLTLLAAVATGAALRTPSRTTPSFSDQEFAA